VHVSEQPPFVRRLEHGAAPELARAPDVVQQCCREQQVDPQPLM
jgi:hypothetical protein